MRSGFKSSLAAILAALLLCVTTLSASAAELTTADVQNEQTVTTSAFADCSLPSSS